MELQNIQRYVRTLLNKWQARQALIYEEHQYILACYIAVDADNSDSLARFSRAKFFVEAYGNEGIGNFVDTFVLLD